MAWIELHQALPTHRKTLRLRALLGLSAAEAVGHLCLIWLWALDNAPKGRLEGIEAVELAQVADFPLDKAEQFMEALTKSGFLDADLTLHDWTDYGGRLQDQRVATRERMRRMRARRKAEAEAQARDEAKPVETDKNGDAVCVCAPNVRNYTTVQDSTVQDSTQQDTTRPSAAEASDTASGERGDTAKASPESGGGGLRAEFEKLNERFSPEWVALAKKRAARRGKPNLGYVTGILESWAQLGAPDEDRADTVKKEPPGMIMQDYTPEELAAVFREY